MSNYSIFALGESQIAISGGGQLDGVTQGNGSHMVGRTITLNSHSFDEVQIRDDDDDFRDSDSSQRLDGAQEIDGQSYGDDTKVEAEYGLTLSDGINTWQAVGFNVHGQAGQAYGSVEGLSFIGGPGGFPPVGVPLTVTDSQEGPNFQAAAYATPVCYARGTLIETPDGPRAVNTLVIGDRITTVDHGAQPVLWVGERAVIGVGRFAPVRIPAGVLGAHRPLQVSQQHRVLIQHVQAELLFGTPEVFVPAISLVDVGWATIRAPQALTYHHLLLPFHGLIRANGVLTESLLADDAAAKFFASVPKLHQSARTVARPILQRRQSGVLLDAMPQPLACCI